MKKALAGIMVLATLCCLAGCGGTSGQNITGITTTDNMVYFEIKIDEKNLQRLNKIFCVKI